MFLLEAQGAAYIVLFLANLQLYYVVSINRYLYDCSYNKVSIATTISPFGLTFPCVVSIKSDISINLANLSAYFGFEEGKYQWKNHHHILSSLANPYSPFVSRIKLMQWIGKLLFEDYTADYSLGKKKKKTLQRVATLGVRVIAAFEFFTIWKPSLITHKTSPHLQADTSNSWKCAAGNT